MPNINLIKLAECKLGPLRSFKCIVFNYYVRVQHCVDFYTVHIPCLPVFANLKLVTVADEPDKKVKYSMHRLKRYSRLTILEEKNNTKKALNKDCKLLTYLFFVCVDLRFKRIGFPKALYKIVHVHTLR